MKLYTTLSFTCCLLTGYVASAQAPSLVPVTDTMLQKPDPSDWLMWRRTLDSWGYSPLNQIDRSNVGKLKMIWMRGMGPGVQEATPLVYHGMMYLPNPSDLVQAINAATGDLVWEYKRKLPDDVTKHLLVPSINRNIAIYNNLIIDTSVDDFVYALDAQTGKLAYENRIVDYREECSRNTACAAKSFSQRRTHLWPAFSKPTSKPPIPAKTPATLSAFWRLNFITILVLDRPARRKASVSGSEAVRRFVTGTPTQ